jgi:TolA-binding protein
LLARVAGEYERFLRAYRDLPYWCAQALRSLGNVRAEQGRLDEAVKLYRRVGEQYPQQDWEVLQAWKSAADLLWDAGRRDEAGKFYRQIIRRFDSPDASAIVQSVVRAAKRRVS